MPLYKANPQFSVWCDFCDNLEDYRPFANRAEAQKKFRLLGWVIGKKVKCPECAALNKACTGRATPPAPADESEVFDVLAHYRQSQSARQ